MRNVLTLLFFMLIAHLATVDAAKITDPILKVGNNATSDFTILHKDGGFLKKAGSNGNWTFSKDGIIEKKLGSGEGGGAGGIISLDNPGFEDGYTSNWTCTATKCTEESTAPLVLEKSLVFNPTAQNDEFHSDLKAIPEGLKGVACEARVYYTGGDENLTAQVVNGDAEVIGSQVLQAHSIAGYESIFFLCPSKDAITADADKGNLQLKVINETATAAASATFDEMYLGSLIGLAETTIPDVMTFNVNTGTGAISENYDNLINGSCSVVSTGRVSCPYTKTFTNALNCSITSGSSGSANICKRWTETTSSLDIFCFNSTTADGATETAKVSCKKIGDDAKQSVQVYKSIPKVAQNINTFNSYVSDDGTIVNSNVPWLDSCTYLGSNYECTFNATIQARLNGSGMHCWVQPQGVDNRTSYMNTVSGTTLNYAIETNDTGSNTTSPVFIQCRTKEEDFIMPTVQPILVNQVETSNVNGSRIEGAVINGTDCSVVTATNEASWISSTSGTSSSGGCGIVYAANTFSDSAVCSATIFSSSASNNCVINGSSASTVGVICNVANNYHIICKGPR